ncbi:phytanoyl-CoA dioxygenase family protein [Reichenbachiella ulvae]|uniref:Phytanoyl-CoA dioxygenase family protein n=1 Tax=Reichenbachiella ulvae TaxID=2980104 RepID=A0ABT3CUE8_9BACT|nr:phytanoyl-CoA dioxygenase family protein [Reichenbachiella ulvae]MCV9387239.1 phytanoyl-CoA dioxygenase family protein [Reichenbachiella ulvae]
MKLNNQQKEFWDKHSYIIFKGLFANRIGEISTWIQEVSKWPEDMSKWLSFYEMDDAAKLSRIENFIPYHSDLASIINGSEVLAIVEELMGESPVLYKERINFKPPGGGAHAAHQDGVAYESGDLGAFDPKVVPYISVLISVDSATKSNGCFEVVEPWGIDNMNILPMEKPYPHAPNFSKIAQSVEDQLNWVQLETQPGDVIFFTERLPHRSKTNTTNKARRILYGVYNPLKEGDKRAKYYSDKRQNINDSRYMVGNPHAPSKLI